MAAQSEAQTRTHKSFPRPRAGNPWFARISLIVVSIIILTNLIAALLLAGYQIYYDGLIYPGVHVWGVDVGGMTPQDAAAALNGKFTYPQMTTISFRDGSDVWQVSAAELGIQFQLESTVQAAYEVGRHPDLFSAIGQQVQAWRRGVVVSPVLIYDQRAADVRLQQIAAAINRPVVDATLVINGTEVVTAPSQIGREVDIAATFGNLNGMITRLESGEVQVVVKETPPAITDAEEAAAIVRTILASDLEVFIAEPDTGDPGPWIAAREVLAQMILIDRAPRPDGQGQMYTVRLNEEQLLSFLTPLQEELQRDPANARFTFDPSSQTLTPIMASITGRELDVPATIQMINQMAPTADHRIPLVFRYTEPGAPDTATAQSLGITEMIASATTYYRGSGEGRRANIATAASKFNGVVVGPGEQFSFNHFLGEVTPETGFSEALIIYNGRTIPGVGGGVCQVSTTAFQAAFYAGFPIEERWPHGYWVNYYDSGEGKGMDATVYEPVVDFKFTNDTSSWLLVQTYVDLPNSTITFHYYSTSDGRTVEKDGPYVTNSVPHGPAIYEENPALAAGTIKQVDYAVNGFDVTVYRTVYRDGKVLYKDSFFSQYIPWQAVYQVAPGYVPQGAY
jgi:vancomycin resistance protein YoaR